MNGRSWSARARSRRSHWADRPSAGPRARAARVPAALGHEQVLERAPHLSPISSGSSRAADGAHARLFRPKARPRARRGTRTRRGARPLAPGRAGADLRLLSAAAHPRGPRAAPRTPARAGANGEPRARRVAAAASGYVPVGSSTEGTRPAARLAEPAGPVTSAPRGHRAPAHSRDTRDERWRARARGRRGRGLARSSVRAVQGRARSPTSSNTRRPRLTSKRESRSGRSRRRWRSRPAVA